MTSLGQLSTGHNNQSLGLICLIYSAYIDLKSSLFDVNDLIDPIDLCEEAVVQRL